MSDLFTKNLASLIIALLITQTWLPLTAWATPSPPSAYVTRYDIDIPAKPLNHAILDLAIIVDASIIAPQKLISGKISNPVKGRYSFAQAAMIMFQNTNLNVQVDQEEGLIIQVPTNEPSVEAPSKDGFNTDSLENVYVTGIKQSLNINAQIKRDSNHILDIVNEEDIGKMPDRTVANILQRIPGVMIDRHDGEGGVVRIHGLDNNRVQLNGSSFLTGMEFFQEDDEKFENSLESIPVPLIQRIEVNKSPTASQIEGSIGGNIDLIGRQGFDFERPFFSIEANINSGEYSQRDLPSGFIAWGGSWQNKFALVASASLDQRYVTSNNIDMYAQGGGFIRATPPEIERSKNSISPPNTQYLANFGPRITDTRKLKNRKGYALNLSYKINDKHQLTFDTLALSNTYKTHQYQIDHSTNGSLRHLDTFELDNSQNFESVRHASYAPARFYNRTRGTVSKIIAKNFNLALESQWSNQLLVHSELQHLQADTKQRSGYTNESRGEVFQSRWVGLNENNPESGWQASIINTSAHGDLRPYSYTFSRDNPAIILDQAQWLTNPNFGVFADNYADGFNTKDKEDNLRLDFTFSSDNLRLKSIKWGLRHSSKKSRFNMLRYLTNYSQTVGAASPRQFDSDGNIIAEHTFDPHTPPASGENNIGIREAVYYDLCNNGGLLTENICDIDGDDIDDNHPVGPYGYHTDNSLGIAGNMLTTSSGILLSNALYGFNYEDSTFFNTPNYSPQTSFIESPQRLHLLTDFFASGGYHQQLLTQDASQITRNVGDWINSISPDSPTELHQAQLQSWQVRQNSSAAYIETDIEFDAVNVNFGVRTVKTDINIRNNELPIDKNGWRITTELADSGVLLHAVDVTRNRSFWNTLPSLNIIWNHTPRRKFRLGIAKQIAYAKLHDLGRGFTPDWWFDDEIPITQGQSGNSELNPYKVSQINVTYENYFAHDSILTFNLFYKNITSFIVEHQHIDEPSANEQVQIIQPRNQDGGKIKGYEANAQKVWSNGLGFNANYTRTNSRSKVNTFAHRAISLPGISEHTLNIVGFYETRLLSLRLAYLWRSKHLATQGSFVSVTPLGSNANTDYKFARFVDADGRWDARINLNIDHSTNVFIEFINLTKTHSTSYLEFKKNLAEVSVVESRWLLGLKWSF